jgi:hypothetical protein
MPSLHGKLHHFPGASTGRLSDSDVRSCISGLARLRREDLEPGLEHLRQDLDTGAWHTRHQDLLDLDAIDAGLRLIVREGP